jgi:hypothetical protein
MKNFRKPFVFDKKLMELTAEVREIILREEKELEEAEDIKLAELPP